MLTTSNEKIQERIDFLIKKEIKPHKILVLCTNTNTKKQVLKELNTKNISILTFQELVNFLSEKYLIKSKYKNISDFCAIQIIYSISKTELIKNEALKNLCKSKTFSRELYNLFGQFKVFNFAFDDLYKINNVAEITDEDRQRFEIILNIYHKYTSFLEEHKLTDYRDIVIKCVDAIKAENALYDTEYEYLLADDAQNLSQLQYELLSLLVKKENISLFADLNAKTKSYMGANIVDYDNVQKVTKSNNKDILKRALFITGNFLDAEQSDSIEYRTFSDVQNEIDFIAKDITENIKKGIVPEEIAILIRDNSIKQTISDLLQKYELPINTQNLNENYQIFKQKFVHFLNLFDALNKLGIKTFQEEMSKTLTIKSKAETQLLIQQLNIYIENILIGVVSKRFLAENFTSKKESNNILTDTIYQNLSLVPEDEQKKITSLFKQIQSLYKFFLNNNLTQIITELSTEDTDEDEIYNSLIEKLLDRATELETVYKNNLQENINIQTILDMLEIQDDDYCNNSCINITTFSKAAGMKFKRVYIPFLTENYFPQKTKATGFITETANNILSDKIQSLNKSFKKIIPCAKEEYINEERLMYVAMLCASEKIILTTHQYEETKQVVPSTFFEQLCFADKYNIKEDISQKTQLQYVKSNEKNKYQDTNTPILTSDDKLILSASSISSFLSCPKLFYYKHLLGLKEESTYKKDYGICVHAIFELLFNKYIEQFSKEKLLELGETLFNSKQNPQNAISIGFDELFIKDFSNLDDLNIIEMEETLNDSIKDLEIKGFFDKKPIEADCEKKFSFSLPEMPNVIFTGYIDAIIKYKDGWTLVDYKTGGNKTKVDKLFNEKELNFLTNDTFSTTKMQSYQYQIPLYYLACCYSKDLEKYKNSLSKIGYQYIRPEYREGSDSDFIEVKGLEQYHDKLIENIKTYIVDEIYKKDYFESQYGNPYCINCSFLPICDKERENNDDC